MVLVSKSRVLTIISVDVAREIAWMFAAFRRRSMKNHSNWLYTSRNLITSMSFTQWSGSVSNGLIKDMWVVLRWAHDGTGNTCRWLEKVSVNLHSKYWVWFGAVNSNLPTSTFSPVVSQTAWCAVHWALIKFCFLWVGKFQPSSLLFLTTKSWMFDFKYNFYSFF